MELGSIILDLDLTDNAPDMQLFYCEVRASNLPTNLSITCLITTLEPALSRQGDLHTSLAGIDEKGSGERTMDDAYVSDEEFHVPFLPQLSPRGVIISRRYILDLALKKLGLTIESTKVIDARDGEMYASMSLHLSADKSRHASEPRMFHGDYAGTKENAIEAASSAVLAFLKDKSMIYVDDGNYHELKACQHKLLAASSWAMLFEDHSSDLKEKMSRMSKEVEDDDQKIDVLSNCQDANNACPLPLVILLLFFIKSFLLYIDAATVVADCEIPIYIHHSAAGCTELRGRHMCSQPSY